MKLIDAIKNIINERLGVPENIADAGEFLYDKIIGLIPNSIHIDDLVEEEFKIPANFQVSDMPIRRFIINFTFDEYPENTLAGAQHESDSELSNDFTIKTNPSNEIKITLRIFGDKNMSGTDVKNILSKDKHRMISILTHEIKHHYDDFKKNYETIKTRIDYTSKSNVNIGVITTINNFILDTYYVHNIENLVRPSELYSNIKTGKITKSQFYKFFTKHHIFERLKKIKNITYENFIENLKNNIDEIKNAFDSNNINYDGLTDDQIVKKLLEITVNKLANFKDSGMQDMLVRSFSEQFFGLRGNKKKFFDSYIRKLEFDTNNPETFFKKEIKIMSFLADKMIKKLAKLYDMTEPQSDTNINEITLWHDETPKSTNKIDTDFKFIPLKKRHPIKNKKPSK